MNNCKEFILDDLMAITAIPVTDYNPGTNAWQVKPTIGNNYFSPTLTNAIVIGRQTPDLPDGAVLIPIKRDTGKVKDAESDSVAGRMHTVTVSCEVDQRDLTPDNNGETVLDYLLTLERTPCHLLLTYRDGIHAFVQATEDTYQCEAEREGSKISVTLRVQNLMGAQTIVESD